MSDLESRLKLVIDSDAAPSNLDEVIARFLISVLRSSDINVREEANSALKDREPKRESGQLARMRADRLT